MARWATSIVTCGVMWVCSYTQLDAAEPSPKPSKSAEAAKNEGSSPAGNVPRGLAHAFLIGFAVGGLWLFKQWHRSRKESGALTQDELRESLERLKKQGEQAR